MTKDIKPGVAEPFADKTTRFGNCFGLADNPVVILEYHIGWHADATVRL